MRFFGALSMRFVVSSIDLRDDNDAEDSSNGSQQGKEVLSLAFVEYEPKLRSNPVLMSTEVKGQQDERTTIG